MKVHRFLIHDVFMGFLILCLLAAPMCAESLHYSLNFAGGVSLGDATVTQNPLPTEPAEKRSGRVMLDASLPGYMIRDEYRSTSDGEFCSSELVKLVSRGAKQTKETDTIDQETHRVTRKTEDGGESDYRVATCAKDAIAYFGYIREELSHGRVPPAQEVILGAAYRVELVYIGSEMVTYGEREVEADKLEARIKGPASDYTVEILFNRDRHRTPLLARMKLPVGDLTVELQR